MVKSPHLVSDYLEDLLGKILDDSKVVAQCTGDINQTSKNLAFAISSCCSPEFLPVCEGSAQNGTCPTLPVQPPEATELLLDEWPLDP